jgi:hypothetical protein
MGIVLLALDRMGLATSREHDATHESQVRTSEKAVWAKFGEPFFYEVGCLDL